MGSFPTSVTECVCAWGHAKARLANTAMREAGYAQNSGFNLFTFTAAPCASYVYMLLVKQNQSLNSRDCIYGKI